MRQSFIHFVIVLVLSSTIQCKSNETGEVYDEKFKELLVMCGDDSCSSNGWCVPLIEDMGALVKKIACRCDRDWGGVNCSKNLLKDKKCSSNGIPKWDEIEEKVICICNPGFDDNDCSTDLLKELPCSENGTPKWNATEQKAKCVCNPGFTGEDCSKNLLKEETCSYNGKSKWDAIEEKVKCVCNPGFGGDDCSENLLLEGICSENGKPKWDEIEDKAKCVCYPGFEGEDCSKYLLKDKKCSGNGIPKWDEIEEKVICICYPGFDDKDCSTDLLKAVPCSENGTPKWNATEEKAKCECHAGFTGKDCSRNLLKEKTCSDNGKPKWNAIEEKVKCVCNPGHGGDDCSESLLLEGICSENGTPKWDEIADKVKCVCQPGFGGEDCSKNLLERVTCSGNGLPKWDEILEEVVCVCYPGFNEKDCNKNACEEKRCSSHGICKWDQTLEVAICVCDLGYNGTRCDINLCQKETCNGNGYCKWNERQNSPECICLNGYTGPNCETNPCKGKICNGRGTCRWNQTINSIECRCKAGFTGDDCELSICEEKICNNRGTCIWKEAIKEAECRCKAGYFGRYCEVDACDTLNCGGNGNCKWVEAENTTQCVCSNGWTGKSCEKNPCEGKTCSAQGVCKWNNVVDDTECICYRGYSGTECELHPCKDKNCSGNGECDWNKEINATVCICNDGFGGDECETDHCEGKICNGNGQCTWDKELGSVKCKCNQGFSGDECDTDLCEKLGCVKGNCEFDTTGKEYCKCDRGFTGEKCNTDICEQLHCTSNGKCELVENGAVCKCYDGFAGEKCEKEFIDFCATNPCMNSGNCKTDGTDYTCECNVHFQGKNCTESIWCKKNPGICGKATCKFDLRNEMGFCDCESKVKYFEKGLCKTITKCTNMIVEGECSGEYHLCANSECKCEENYKMDTNSNCIPNFCSKNPCKETEDCKELGEGRTTCTCKDGYYFDGSKCKKVDPCTARTTKCQQQCVQKSGECKCFEGFDLNEDNATCTRVEEETACNLDCGVGVCIKSGDAEKCFCPSTHSNINNTCIDICTAKRLPKETCPQGLCIPDEKYGFICDCSNPLYKQGKDGIHCERKMMCTEGGGDQVCAQLSAKCVDNHADKTVGFSCICDKESEKDVDGVCRNKCELKKHRNRCEKLFAVCVLNSDFEPVCKCPPLLSQKYEHQPCNVIEKNSYTGIIPVRKDRYITVEKGPVETIDTVKLTNELEKSLQHVYQNVKDTKLLSYTEDEPGVLNCVVEMQLRTSLGKEQVNQIVSPSVCVSLNETFCWIKPYLVVKNVPDGKIFKQTEACMDNVRERLCGSTTNCTHDTKSFQCECKPGFDSTGSYNPTNDLDSFVQRCEDRDECLDLKSCPHRNSTKCFNTYGSYECLCKDGYKPNDKENIETKGCTPVCNPNPCVHGSCIQVGSDGFSCSCHGLYTGYLCNATNEVVMKAKAAGLQQSTIIGGALGAILFLMVLIAIVLFRRNRKLSKGEHSGYQMQGQQSAATAMSRLAHRPAQVVEQEERNVERVQDRPSGSRGHSRPVRIHRLRNNDEEIAADTQEPRRQPGAERRTDSYYKSFDNI